MQLRCGAPVAVPVTVTGVWQRFSVTSPDASIDRFQLLLYGGDPNQIASLHVWGAQLELGSAATTYNSTTVKNLLGFSEAFDNAAWSKTRTSIVTGAQANPVNGAFNAQKLMEDTTASATHPVSAGITFTAIPYTMSIYAKAAGRNWIYLALLGTTNSFASFNLSNGTVGTIGAAATATIQDVGNGWYRCRITSTATAGAGTAAFYPASANDTISYTGDGNSGVYIYGAQLSDSASLDPYVPTPAAAPSSTAYYGPRFDYDPVTLQPKGLLVEEARTNIATYSAEFDNAAWSKINCTVTTNATTSPDGTTNAEKLIVTNALSTGNVSQIPTLAASTAYTETVFAKKGEWNWVALETRGEVGDPLLAWFNLNTGVVGTVNVGATATITNFGNGWYRCSLTRTTGATTTSPRARVYATNADAVLSTGDGVSGIFIYGAQLEAGAFPTSYIPTVASTVTRSADVATINGSLFSQWYNNTEGTLLANFVPTNSIASNTRGATITDGTNRVTDIYIDVSVWRSFNGTTNVTPAGSTAVLNSTVNFASAYKSGDYAASMNGGAVGTAATAGVQSANKLTIGTNITNSAGFLNGHIRSINFIPARAADFQLQALTT